MEIKHTTITQIDTVIETYKKTEDADITYVCTTDLITTDTPVDVFYRATPHPEHGNNYFGLLINGGVVEIVNADMVTNLHFGMVENDDGLLEYSRTANEAKAFKNGNTISGGRVRIKSNAPCDIFKIVDGNLQLEAKFDEYNTVDGTEEQ
jgi:hypothetical protein